MTYKEEEEFFLGKIHKIHFDEKRNGLNRTLSDAEYNKYTESIQFKSWEEAYLFMKSSKRIEALIDYENHSMRFFKNKPLVNEVYFFDYVHMLKSIVKISQVNGYDHAEEVMIKDSLDLILKNGYKLVNFTFVEDEGLSGTIEQKVKIFFDKGKK